MAEEEEIKELAEAFFALSNERRLQLLFLLTNPRYREEIAEELGVSRQAATKHIEKLLEHGFVIELQGWRKTGPVEEYRVNPKRLFSLGMTLADLGKLEPHGGPERAGAEPTQVVDDANQGSKQSTTSQHAHLLILNGPDAGERFVLEGEGPRWTIGREEDRDLVLDHDPYISGSQCEIQLAPEGHAIVDVYSSNGTFVNFGRLPHGGRTTLDAGDVIGIGRSFLVYQRG